MLRNGFKQLLEDLELEEDPDNLEEKKKTKEMDDNDEDDFGRGSEKDKRAKRFANKKKFKKDDLDEETDDDDLDEETVSADHDPSKIEIHTKPQVDKRRSDKRNSEGKQKQGSSDVKVMKQKVSEMIRNAKKDDVDLSEDIAALFGDEELSDEFKENATTIFETAVNSKISEVLEKVKQSIDEELEARTEELNEEFSEKVNKYLTSAVENWIVENEVAINNSIQVELAENFMTGMKKLFEDNYVSIPDEKTDILEELSVAYDDVKESLNEQIEANVELKDQLAEYQRQDIIFDLSDGMSDTQFEKFKTLAENVEFDDMDEYKEKLETIKEGYFSGKKVSLSENFEFDEDEIEDNTDNNLVINDPRMKAYMDNLTKTVRK